MERQRKASFILLYIREYIRNSMAGGIGAAVSATHSTVRRKGAKRKKLHTDT